MSLSQRLQHVLQSRSVKYGLPFVIMIVGGSFGLKEFAQLRYDFSKKKLIDPNDMADLGIKMKEPKEVTLESEYEKIRSLDIEEWENKRGPRPWEE